MNVDVIFERRGLCPYTDICESYATIMNSERWMRKALYRLRKEGASSLSRAEGGCTIQTLQDRLEHLRKVKRRCNDYHGRCLRFWQFEKKREDNKASSLVKKHLEMRDAPPIIPYQQPTPPS